MKVSITVEFAQPIEAQGFEWSNLVRLLNTLGREYEIGQVRGKKEAEYVLWRLPDHRLWSADGELISKAEALERADNQRRRFERKVKA